MKNIIITGYKGTIGQILIDDLKSDYMVKGVDLPEVDLTDLNATKKAFLASEIVIHLAWNVLSENFRNGNYDPANSQMFYNVYKAAIEVGVKRVIMASSIHARAFDGNNVKGILPSPDSPYGADKVFMEELGKMYSRKGIEVICVRFGGINLLDEIDPSEHLFSSVWLSQRDCRSLIRLAITAKTFPNNFVIVNAVSNNSSKIHNTKNPLGWVPLDDSSTTTKQISRI